MAIVIIIICVLVVSGVLTVRVLSKGQLISMEFIVFGEYNPKKLFICKLIPLKYRIWGFGKCKELDSKVVG